MGYNDFHGQQEEYRKLSEVKNETNLGTSIKQNG